MLVLGAPRVVRVRVEVRVHVGDFIVTARSALHNAARGLHDTMYI